VSFAGASDFIKWSIYTHETAKTFILLNEIIDSILKFIFLKCTCHLEVPREIQSSHLV